MKRHFLEVMYTVFTDFPLEVTATYVVSFEEGTNLAPFLKNDLLHLFKYLHVVTANSNVVDYEIKVSPITNEDIEAYIHGNGKIIDISNISNQ
jgi:hypothetical protein